MIVKVKGKLRMSVEWTYLFYYYDFFVARAFKLIMRNVISQNLF